MSTLLSDGARLPGTNRDEALYRALLTPLARRLQARAYWERLAAERRLRTQRRKEREAQP